MILRIRLKNITPESTYEDRINALKLTAQELQQLNQLPELATDPIRCNPDAEIEEGHLGDCNTPVTRFGDVSVMVNNYSWIDLPDNIVPQTFSFVFGRPTRTWTDPITGEILQESVGQFTQGENDYDMP